MNPRQIYLAVDSDNVCRSAPEGSQIDYQALLNLAGRLGAIAEAAIYTSRGTGSEQLKDRLVHLKGLGYTRVIYRPHRCRPDGTKKSDIDAAMIVDIYEAALRGRLDTLILVSGDSDFAPLVERLAQQGFEVYVVGPDAATAWELVVAATQFCYTSEVAGLIHQGKSDQPALAREIAQAA